MLFAEFMKTPEEIILEAAAEICRRIERPMETHGAACVDVITKAISKILSVSSHGARTIHVSSLISHLDQHGKVAIEWEEKRAVFTPEEARQHAKNITEAAEAAQTD
jgi:hypothetical protein